MQTLPTRSSPQTEPPPSSDSRSKLTPELKGLVKNGAAAWRLLFHRYAVAESDCNLAIVLDGKYPKAYARRGAARFALGKHESALEGEPRFKQ